jgi:hypothetical protein
MYEMRKMISEKVKLLKPIIKSSPGFIAGRALINDTF